MNDNIGFILKVLLLSVGLSLFIKYVGPSLSIAPTVSIALGAVLTPTLILAVLLGRMTLLPARGGVKAPK